MKAAMARELGIMVELCGDLNDRLEMHQEYAAMPQAATAQTW
jgi:hypothetical protein